ncbi:hypothetical protein GCM10027271_28720 [Saccharopolyspora gloriosae]|uniref:Uncharacterized protein n=1 Tax=Saccharopolyspora gloriosae TaxID=455344 RepID=A0A840NMF2_9PSEU|nr:hypothetical protein [Saccharopolyspora gloriosae]MBB5071293.1 hypothetical protein [Saccharopolyspora gloriosae]
MAEREDALLAAFPRELDEDALGVLVGPDRAGEVFRRLRRHPFVRESRGRLTYDDVVREAMVRYSRGRSPERFAAGNRSLARHYLARREGLGGGTAPAAVDDEWRSLLVDECYHRLCGGPRSALPAVLAWGEELCAAGAPAALAWLDMFADAERDTDSGLLREWWQKLAPFADAVRASMRKGSDVHSSRARGTRGAERRFRWAAGAGIVVRAPFRTLTRTCTRTGWWRRTTCGRARCADPRRP